ncbi:MAG: hypothetical protein WKF77_07235 [Planctomycetaceae bacterium]
MTETVSPSNSHDGTVRRLNHAMGPVVAGMIIDAVDFVTFGPIGLALGIPIGAIAGYWLGQSMGLGKNACLFCAVAAGIYCTIPFTELLPLGTMVGALVRYKDATGPQVPAESTAATETQPVQNSDETE